MPTSTCWLRSDGVQRQLEDFFRLVDETFCETFNSDPTVAEPHLDGHLLSLIGMMGRFQLPSHLDRISLLREKEGKPSLKLGFTIKHITGTESRHGADIGVVLQAQIENEYVIKKAVLIQSKRLYPDHTGKFSAHSQYQELYRSSHNASGKVPNTNPQWDRMLGVTPSSVYLLYGPKQFYSGRGFKDLG